MKRFDIEQLHQKLDAGDYLRRGQHLHDEAVYKALSSLIGLVGKVFSLGHDKGFPPVMPKKGSRRGWAA